MDRFDAIVFGAGMVGAAVALGLAKQGKSVAVIEPHLPSETFAQTPDMRVSAISLASEETLSHLGAWCHIAKERMKPYNRLSVWEKPEARTSFDCDLIGQSHLGHILENRALQLALLKALREIGCVTWFTHGDLIDANKGRVKVATQNMADNQGLVDEKMIEGKLLVVAEGGQSKTRDKLGLGTSGWQYQQHVLAIAVSLDQDSGSHTWQQFTPAGPKGYLPLFGNYASLVWYAPKHELDALRSLSSSDFKKKVASTFAELPDNFDILNTAEFPITRMHAQRYGTGRVLLVGDAAHTINPLAGQGVNLGFKDVKCLLNMLEEQPELIDKPARLLSLYERKRRPDNLLMMSAMDGFYALFSNDNSVLRTLRNAALSLANKQQFAKQQVLKYACGVSLFNK